ncbi:head vertex protein [Pantoea phage Phynn]|nr:head vertex protein [Pantoea phage Phynn]
MSDKKFRINRLIEQGYKRAVKPSALDESTTSADNSVGRPDLLALTRATTSLIFTELVAVQKTRQPVAALFGVKYIDPLKQMPFTGAATYGGEINLKERQSIPDFDKSASLKKGDMFQHESVVYKVLKDAPFDGTAETENIAIIGEAIINNSIRFMSDAANTSHFEDRETEVSQVGLRLDKWNVPVRTRKLKTELTVELAQDLEANSFDAPETFDDLLATMMATEVNKDIIQKLITVSTRFRVNGVTDKGVLDLSGLDAAPEQGRKLYRYVCEMNSHIQRTTTYTGSYVLASSRVSALLHASGWVKEDEDNDLTSGKLNNGLPLYTDPLSPLDYVIVGVKENYGQMEHVGSLFYAPYVEEDGAGAYKIVVDPNSLQPSLSLMIRYGLSVNPYTTNITDSESRVIVGDDFDNLAGTSLMSVLLGVKLPTLIGSDEGEL